MGSSAFGRSWWVLILAIVMLVAAAVWVIGLAPAKLSGRTPAERIASICRVADQRPWGAGKAVAAAAVGDSDASVRAAALVALGKFIDESAHREVVESAAGDGDPGVRSAAATTLGLYRDEAAVDRLSELLSSDRSEQVRMAAALGLIRTGRPRGILVLVEAMASNDNPNVQFRAMEVLTNSFNIRFRTPRDPRDRAAWAQRVGVIRNVPTVRYAREAVEGKARREQQH